MKKGWQTKTLGEVCEVMNGGTPKTGVPEYWDGSHLWITPAEMGRRLSPYVSDSERKITDLGLRDSSARMLPPNSVILSSRAPIGHLVINTEPMATNQGCKGLIPGSQLQHKFLYFYLSSIVDLLNSLGTGATFRELSGGKLKEVTIPVPPLPEQQRIVSILDEAFEGVATAKANAEKNLYNARALFESHLQSVFTQRGKGWVVRRISEIAKHTLGKMLDKAKNKGVLQPYLRNINVRWFTFDLSDLLQMPFLPQEAAKYTAIKGDILICEGGYPGRAAIWDGDYPIYFQKALHRVRFHEPEHSKWFVYYLFAQDKSGELKPHFSGTGIQHFTGEVLARFELPLPPLSELRRAVARFEELSAETQRIESIYQQKLAALEALKKSLLHQAFTGQLIADSIAVSAPAPIRFPTELEGISTTDLHAGILALSHQFHEKAGKLEHFGHVKAEKIAHMIEARLGIDLGRKPMKDAAGPNDFPHLHKVEHRARKANFFDFKRVEGAAYRVHKLRSFDRLIERTRAALGGRANVVDGLLELMLPMQTQQAEIFCTVYAAWNNLLLDGKRPTDEEIVFEARENWHPDKLKIPRERFFSAIEWIRNKALTPSGNGKKVCSRVE
jgi:type I restriction enzyme S subunit